MRRLALASLLAMAPSVYGDVVVKGETWKAGYWPDSLTCPVTLEADKVYSKSDLDQALVRFIERNLLTLGQKPADTTTNTALNYPCTYEGIGRKPFWYMNLESNSIPVAIDLKTKEYWFCGAISSVPGPSGYPEGCSL